jgi:hypothetical protein
VNCFLTQLTVQQTTHVFSLSTGRPTRIAGDGRSPDFSGFGSDRLYLHTYIHTYVKATYIHTYRRYIKPHNKKKGAHNKGAHFFLNPPNIRLGLPTGPAIKTATSATKNAPVIITPEMANDVRCPDTGESLKHQELITLLRYNI